MSKTALITGITGQDGSYLSELLLEKGYQVVGLTRRTNAQNLRLFDQVKIVSGDLLDQESLFSAMKRFQPDEVYNLAAHSFVHSSWINPVQTSEFTAIGVTRVLEAIRKHSPKARFYQASSSEVFGKARSTPQNEETAFHPRSPYGVAKVYGHFSTLNFRESFGIHASSGILFNHESPRRGIEYVTRKITQTAAKIKLGLAKELRLGNLEARRDWGFAGDYVKAMWLMLQQDIPNDYVVGTGETHSVRDFAQIAFSHLGLDYEKYVVVDPAFYRPNEVEKLVADPSRAKKILGWVPTVGFQKLVAMMVDSDFSILKEQKSQ